MTPPAARPDTVRRATERADVALLSGAAAGELLAAVLDAEGVALKCWSVHQVHHRPGVGVTVGYAVTWSAPGPVPRGGDEYLLATTCPVGAADVGAGVTTVTTGERTVHVWRHPVDPCLPGLAAASSVEDVAALLGCRTQDVGLELVTYRPLRRAVVRARAAGETHYLKVVRPHTAAGLVARHAMLLDAGLPAAPVRSGPEGVLILGEVAGPPLTQAMAHDGAADLAPEVVTRLLDRLPAEALNLPRRPAWAERVAEHGSAAAASLPEQRAEIGRMVREITSLMTSSDAGPVVPTHGDLHDGNLLVEGGRVVGLLDVDTLGPGHRVDDLACLLAHLSVLPAIAPDAHRHVPAVLPRWTTALAAGVDPVALRARAAAVTLSLVAGARREDDTSWRDDAARRLAVAQTWLDLARATRHGSLRGLSSSRPSPLMGEDESSGQGAEPGAALGRRAS